LIDTDPKWTVKRLTAAADAAARKTVDFSLVGLAARVRDAVVLTALRESVVLYAEKVMASAPPTRPAQPEYVWKVDRDLAEHAKRFIDTFNILFGENLPPPEPAQAERYWYAYTGNEIVGRCVNLGKDIRPQPIRYYHWAICRGVFGEFTVQEFWHSEMWTTARYRSAMHANGRCPRL
jgi:hypothetical protein